MASYSIWIPNGSGSPADVLASVGMGDLGLPGDLSPSAAVALAGASGPTDTSGSLLQWIDPTVPPDRACRLGYQPQHQAWSPLPAFKLNGESKPKGSVWIGFEKDRPVTPSDLLRKSGTAGQPKYLGESLVLGDGQVWHFPNQFNLPMEFAIDPDTGDDKKVVTAEQQPVWERMQAAFHAAKTSHLRDQHNIWEELPETARAGLDAPEAMPSESEWTDYQIHDYVIWALSLNYRITKLIAVGLRLFNNANLWQALYKTTDVGKIIALQIALKKTQVAWEHWRAGMFESPAVSGGVAAA